ncbi:hypothetical protein HRbin30_02356 [bacterium HR30]|nr:hypothetical protein HRbin30_02356 [bacterium HR30]
MGGKDLYGDAPIDRQGNGRPPVNYGMLAKQNHFAGCVPGAGLQLVQSDLLQAASFREATISRALLSLISPLAMSSSTT